MHAPHPKAGCPTLSWCRLVALFQSLSSRMRVMRGKRIDMPSAVCISDLENSAPVISQTGASCSRHAAAGKLPMTRQTQHLHCSKQGIYLLLQRGKRPWILLWEGKTFVYFITHLETPKKAFLISKVRRSETFSSEFTGVCISSVYCGEC